MFRLDFTLLLPDPNLPGAKQKTPFNINRYVLLIITIVWLFATSCVFLGWPSLASMLYKSGAYEWVCAKDTEGNYVNDQRLLSNKQYICDEQDTKVQPLLTIAAFCSFLMAAFSGWLVDIAGPKLTGTLGQILLCTSWLSLAFSSEVFEWYYVAFSFMGLGAGCVVIPAIGISRLFPDMIAVVITLTGAAQSASYAVPVILDMIYECTNISFRKLCLYYLCICLVSGVIIAFFLFPSKQYMGTDLLKINADNNVFPEDDKTKTTRKACNNDTDEEVQSLTNICMVGTKQHKVMLRNDTKNLCDKKMKNLVECCTLTAPNHAVHESITGDLSSQFDGKKGSKEDSSVLDFLGELQSQEKTGNFVVGGNKRKGDERQNVNVENQHSAIKGKQQNLQLLGEPGNKVSELPKELKKNNLEFPGGLGASELSSAKSLDGYSKEADKTEAPLFSYKRNLSSSSVLLSSSSILSSTSSSFSYYFSSSPTEKLLGKLVKKSFYHLVCKSLLLCQAFEISYAFVASFFSNIFESKQKKERSIISGLEGNTTKKRKELSLPFFSFCCCFSSPSSSQTTETKKNLGDMTRNCIVLPLYTQEKNVLPNSIKRKTQGFSESCKIACSFYFIAIFVYFVVSTTTSTYYMLSSNRIFSSSVIQSLSISLPFTFIPCIILGLFIDIFGIMFVIVFVNVSTICSFLFTLFTTPLHISHYLSVFFYCIACSVQCSQVFCFLEQTFPSIHFGKLSGIILFIGGSVSLLCIPIYNKLVVRILSGKPFIVTLSIIVVHTAMLAMLIYLWLLKKKKPRPFDYIIRKL